MTLRFISMLPVDILEKLRAADWERIYPALVAYAKHQIWRLPLVKGGGPLPGGRRAKDIVQQAIRLVFEGKRQWDPEKDPDLALYLKTSVVRSLISNLVSSADHRLRDAGDPVEAPDLDGHAGTSPDPSLIVASDECVEVLREIVEHVTADDERLAMVQMGLEDGTPRDEIAELLSIEVGEVYTLTRKLRRRLFSAMGEHECWEGHPFFTSSTVSR